jgi:hypothetical protein
MVRKVVPNEAVRTMKKQYRVVERSVNHKMWGVHQNGATAAASTARAASATRATAWLHGFTSIVWNSESAVIREEWTVHKVKCVPQAA